MRLVHILAAISLSAVTITTIIINTGFSLPFYQQKFAQYQVDQLFSPGQPSQATQNIIDYTLNGGSLDTQFFNPPERSHLADVKTFVAQLIRVQRWSVIILFGSIAGIFIRTKRLRHVFFIIRNAGYINLALMTTVVGVYVTSGFNQLFLKFHQLFFIDNFSFDPATSQLKALYPDAIFFDLAKTIVLNIIISGIVYIMLAKLSKIRHKSQE